MRFQRTLKRRRREGGKEGDRGEMTEKRVGEIMMEWERQAWEKIVREEQRGETMRRTIGRKLQLKGKKEKQA